MAPVKTLEVEDELRQLQLEESRFRVRGLRSEQEMRRIRRDAIETALKAEMQRESMLGENCTHKKGGMGIEEMFAGQDSKYAVIKHQMPTGEIHVFCQRCTRHWGPPDKNLVRQGATKAEREQYAREMQEYRLALRFPTNNTMSGSQLFVVTRDDTRPLLPPLEATT